MHMAHDRSHAMLDALILAGWAAVVIATIVCAPWRG